jgi:hypothetical protein
LERLREIVEMPLERSIRKLVRNPDTGVQETVVVRELDPNVAKIILQAVQMLQLRVHGPPVQRIETRTMNLNAQITAPKSSGFEKLHAEMKKLEVEGKYEVVTDGPKEETSTSTASVTETNF